VADGAVVFGVRVGDGSAVVGVGVVRGGRVTVVVRDGDDVVAGGIVVDVDGL
jgi:hypothetical protein